MKITPETLAEIADQMVYCGGGQYIIRGAWEEMREKLIVLPARPPRTPAKIVHRVYSYPAEISAGVPWAEESIKVWKLEGELPENIRTDGKITADADRVMLRPPPRNSQKTGENRNGNDRNT